MANPARYYHRDGTPIYDEEEGLKVMTRMWSAASIGGDHSRVALTELSDDVTISTVFLCMNHGWGGSVQIFESMVFGLDDEDGNELQWRYTTELEALVGHVRYTAWAFERILDPPPKPRVRWKLMKWARARWERQVADGRQAGQGTGLGTEPGGTGETP